MKKFILSILSLFFLVGCQQEMIVGDAPMTRSMSSNAFVFEGSYMSWNERTYMLDFGFVGSSDVPLDKPIFIWYKIIYMDGTVSPSVFLTVPAGRNYYSSEGSSLGEELAASDGRAGAIISDIMYGGYSYQGTLDIIGLDDLY